MEDVVRAQHVMGSLPNTTFCQWDYVPPMPEYYTAINTLGIILFTVGAASVVFIMLVYADTLRHIMRNASPLVKTHSSFVLSVYPVVAIATYSAIVVPRAQLLAEAVTQGVFMAAMYQLFCLLMAYCGGEAEMIRKVKPETLNLRVGPCCCLPCCLLPQLPVDKEHVRHLRLLVLQLPIVQGLVYMVLLVMWAEEESLYQVNYMYLQPVVIMSILFGVWGMSVTIKLLADVLKEYQLQAKFMVLQMVLILAKLQGLTARIVVWCGLVSCRPPITPAVYANLIYNSAMLGEMVILGVIARLLYRRKLPDVDLIEAPLPQEICIISNNVQLEKAAKDNLGFS